MLTRQDRPTLFVPAGSAAPWLPPNVILELSLGANAACADEHADFEHDTALKRVLDHQHVALVDLHVRNARAHLSDEHVDAHGTAVMRVLDHHHVALVEHDTALQHVLDKHQVALVNRHERNARAHLAEKHVKAHRTAVRARLVDQQLVASAARRRRARRRRERHSRTARP